MKYPLKPKSTSYMEQGQFWAIPIGEDRYSCGVVLALVSNGDKRDSRMFLAGLLNWFGHSLPNTEQLNGSSVLNKGFAHIKTITETGGEILGKIDSDLGCPPIVMDTDEIATWGYNSIAIKSAKQYAGS